MARVEYPTVDSPDAQQMEAEIRQQRQGRFPHLFHMQMYNPAIADGWLRLGTAVRFKSDLPEAVRELAICLVARTTGADYEWQAHRRLAIEAGFSEAAVDDVLNWRNGDFDQRLRAVLAFAEASTKNVAVDDATFAELKER